MKRDYQIVIMSAKSDDNVDSFPLWEIVKEMEINIKGIDDPL